MNTPVATPSVWLHIFILLQPASPLNGERSPRENGPSKKKEGPGPASPRSDGSSHSSTPSSKHKEVCLVSQL